MEGMKPTRSSRPVRGTVKGTFNARGNAPSAASKRGGLTLTRLLAFAPIAIEVAAYLRGQQKAKRGKYYKASRRGQAFDFVLGQAQRRFGKTPPKTQPRKKGWF